MARRSQVSVLLDTCALLALSRGDLPSQSASTLSGAAEACVSVVSPWEVAIKERSGKLRLQQPVLTWFEGLIEGHDLRDLSLDARIVCRAAALPLIHRDPFDRILIATAQIHSLVVLTSDTRFARYPGVDTLW